MKTRQDAKPTREHQLGANPWTCKAGGIRDCHTCRALCNAAPEYDLNARQFVKDAEAALAPGSQANFMNLVNLLSRHIRAAKTAIAKAEGR